MQEASGTFDKFLVKQLSEEIKELHTERATQKDPVAKLEEFVTAQLSEEIPRFQKRSFQDVANTKVRLVKEAPRFDELKSKLSKHTGKAVNEAVTQIS